MLVTYKIVKDKRTLFINNSYSCYYSDLKDKKYSLLATILAIS